MSARGLGKQLDRLEADISPRCVGVREIISYREGEPKPVPPRCPRCSRPGCGVLLLKEVVVVAKNADGNLVDWRGDVVPWPPKPGEEN
jgi:hypothetical protein